MTTLPPEIATYKVETAAQPFVVLFAQLPQPQSGGDDDRAEWLVLIPT